MASNSSFGDTFPSLVTRKGDTFTISENCLGLFHCIRAFSFADINVFTCRNFRRYFKKVDY